MREPDMKTKLPQISALVLLVLVFGLQMSAQVTDCTVLSGSATNTQTAGYAGTSNIAIGSDCGFSLNSLTAQNTLMGVNAGYYIAGGSTISLTDNTFIGFNSGYTNGHGDLELISDGNTFIGSNSGYSNYAGAENAFLGLKAGYLNSTGSWNTNLGPGAGYFNTTNNGITAIGYECLFQNTAAYNTGIGYLTGYGMTTGTDNFLGGDSVGYSIGAGEKNVCIGNRALFTGTGSYNVLLGYNAMSSATTESYNVGIGNQTLAALTGGYVSNTAVGYGAMQKGATGSYNSAFGDFALYKNTDNFNCAFGYGSMLDATSGGSNSAYGSYSLGVTTAAVGNSGFGYKAGYTNTTGTYNTFIGYTADANATNLTNATAIGNGAVALTSNEIMMGNSSVTTFTGTPIYSGSDGRFKTNVVEIVKGLAFIKKLRPVTYNLDTKALNEFMIQNMSDSSKALHRTTDFTASTAIVHSGFIAQEVDQTAQSLGFTSSLVHEPSNSNDIYGLSYSEFVVPLVKAVQELSLTTDSIKLAKSKQDSLVKYLIYKTDSLQTVGKKQDSINNSLQSQINRIVNSCCPLDSRHEIQNKDNGSIGTKAVGSQSVDLSDASTIVLNQNTPNPFAEQTTITYNIPQIISSAQILFYNTNGVMIKSAEIKTAGAGQLNVYANDLSNGIYSYTLVVDGNIIATKKMVKQQ